MAEALLALLGVLLGAGVTTVVAMVQAERQRRHELSRDLAAIRRSTYAELLAASSGVQHTADALTDHGARSARRDDEAMVTAMDTFYDAYHRARLLAGPELEKPLGQLRKKARAHADALEAEPGALRKADGEHQASRRRARILMKVELGVGREEGEDD